MVNIRKKTWQRRRWNLFRKFTKLLFDMKNLHVKMKAPRFKTSHQLDRYQHLLSIVLEESGKLVGEDSSGQIHLPFDLICLKAELPWEEVTRYLANSHSQCGVIVEVK